MPTFSDDDVTDFMVKEAVVHRVSIERARAQRVHKVRKTLEGHKDFAKEMNMIPGGR